MTLTQQDQLFITKTIQTQTKNILNGQSSLKNELLNKIAKLQNDMDKKFGNVDKRFNNVDKKIMELTKRIDKIGLAVARLEDDTPTVEEFDKLKKKVIEIEQTLITV